MALEAEVSESALEALYADLNALDMMLLQRQFMEVSGLKGTIG